MTVTSEEEDAYALLTAYLGTPEEVAKAAYGQSEQEAARHVGKSRASRVGYLEHIEVVERRKGIGAAMVREALQEMKKRGVKRRRSLRSTNSIPSFLLALRCIGERVIKNQEVR